MTYEQWNRWSGRIALVAGLITVLGYFFIPVIGAVAVFVCLAAVQQNMHASNGWGTWGDTPKTKAGLQEEPVSVPFAQPDTEAGRRLLRVILDATGSNFDLVLGQQPSEVIRAIEDEARRVDVKVCICGTEAALRAGKTMFVRMDVVCPKHDR